MPFDPATSPSGSGANPNIWDGTYTSLSPDGNGNLNEFCIHISHPNINDGAPASFTSLERPSVTLPGTMAYPAFRHALGFEVDTNITSSIPSAVESAVVV
jgi:hypothetical protein